MNFQSQRSRIINICFIAPSAYSLLSKCKTKNVIGPDVDQVTLARELCKKGHKITFIIYQEGNLTEETIDGIHIIKTYKPNSKINLFSKLIHIWKALKKADADIYFHYGDFMGLTSIFTFLKHKKSVYKIGSDFFVNKKVVYKKIQDFSSSKFSLRSIGNWIDIKLADIICVQTKYQYKMLKENYGKKGVIIKNHIKIKNGTVKKAKKFVVLWVGSIADVKQPLLFIDLAKNFPNVSFWMVGGHKSDKLYESFLNHSKNLDNFEFFGPVPPNEINVFFEKASILVNTSMFEGFPNSFIQAWMNCTPVVSLNADPDGSISKFKLGFHSGTITVLNEDLKKLLEDDNLRQKMGCNGREYVEKNHNIEDVVNKYVKLFNQLIN